MKLHLSLLTSGLAACLLAAPLSASLVTYTYTGNDFTIATDQYSTSDSVSGFFTLAAALGDNLSDVGITPNSYSFTDGVQTFTNSSPPATVTFDFSTDASGHITQWFVFLQNTSGSQTNTVSTGSGIPVVTRDFGNEPFGQGEGQGVIFDNPGTWVASSGTSPVPEPGNVGLIGFGLVAMGLFWKNRRTGNA